MRVVLDSNVLVAAFATRGLCEAVYQLCLAKHEIVLCEPILHEVQRTLRTKLKLPAVRGTQIISLIRETSQIVKPLAVPEGSCRDPADLAILGTAAAAKADCLVTGDQDLLVLKEYAGTRIFSPRGFYDNLR